MATHHVDISDYEKDPRLFLFTSLTAGSSHIITATSRMETILKANKIPFQAIDLATDEKARRLWQRRAKERKLPGLVKDGFVLGDLDEIEEWNEFGELKENIGPVPASTDKSSHTVKTGVSTAPPLKVNPTATQGTTNISTPPVNKAPQPNVDESKFRALPGAAEIAERNKAKAAEPSPEQKEGKSVIDENAPPKAAEGMMSAPKEKEESINAAKKMLGEIKGKDDHLSAPPSAMQSGTATPEPEKLEVEGAGAEEEKLTHRGSEVKEADAEEVKKVESENSLAEAAEEEEVKTSAEKALGTEVKDVEAKTDAQKAVSTAVPDATAAGEGKEAVDVKKPAVVEPAATAGEEKASEPKDTAAAAVGASDSGEGKTAEEVKEQSAKEGEDAGKSVGD